MEPLTRNLAPRQHRPRRRFARTAGTLLLFCLTRAGSLSAVASVWTTSGPEGATVNALVADPRSAGTIYAATEGGVFKTVDGGAHWASLTGLGPIKVQAIAVAPSRPDTVYAAGVGDIFKSSNGGATWASVRGGVIVNVIAVDPASPDYVYVGMQSSPDRILKSTDGGGTWTPINTGLPQLCSVGALAIDPSTPSTLYAGVSDCGGPDPPPIYKSTDSGANWATASVGVPTYAYPKALAVDPGNSATLYVATYNLVTEGPIFKSTNGAVNWSPASAGFNTQFANSLALTASTLYAATEGGGVLKSSNGGASWIGASVGLPNQFVKAIVPDPVAPGTVYAGSSTGISKSTSAGGTWVASNTGLTALAVSAVAVDPGVPTTVYGGTAGGVFGSSNGGASWRSLSVGLANPYVRTVAIDPVSRSTLYAGTAGGVFKSTNAGATWVAASAGFPAAGLLPKDIRALAIDPTDSRTIYAGTLNYGIYKTTDGGATWGAINNGLLSIGPYGDWVTSLAIDPTAPTTIYATSLARGIFRSVDGGTTWVPANSGIGGLVFSYGGLAVDPALPTTLYAGMGSRVYKSTDGANSWVGVPGSPSYVKALVVAPPGGSSAALYAGTLVAGVFSSTDGGATWSAMNDGLTDLRILALAIDPTGTMLHAGTAGGGEFDLQLAATPPGPFTLTGSAYCNTTPPAAPAVRLSWTDASDASSYSVYRDASLYAPDVTQTSFDNNTNVTAGHTYTYFVRASNANGSNNSNTISINVPTNVCAGCSLMCSATAAPSSAAAGLPVAFRAGATASDCAGDVVYDWDFGDNSPHDSAQNPSHPYATLGNYQWTMTATAQGQACTKYGTVMIQPPVLFVHGICSDASTWITMISNLRGLNTERYGDNVVGLYFDGADVRTLHGTALTASQVYAMSFYNPKFENVGLGFGKDYVVKMSIKEEAYQLARVIEKIRALNNDAPTVDLVTHSMGGLVARSYLEGLARDPQGRTQSFRGDVRRVVTIDTPHSGISILPVPTEYLPDCIIGSSLQKDEMDPRSNFLSLLNSLTIPSPPSNRGGFELLTSIASNPAWSAWLPDWYNDGDGLLTYESQNIRTLPEYKCLPDVETIPNVVNEVVNEFSDYLPMLHTKVQSLLQTAQLVNSRIAVESVTRLGCETLTPGVPTRIVPDAAAGTFAYRVDLSFSATGTAVALENPKAGQACTVDVVARSDSGAELARRTVPAESFQSVALGVLPGSGWHVELVPTCSGVVSATVTALPPCGGDPSILCLSSNRFAVQVSWRVPILGTQGVGNAVSISADTGYFWFFSDTNVELIIKVLDARPIGDNHFWVFYGALSDVEYTITVTDTQTGAVRNYDNPYHHFGSVADTSAFAAETSGTETRQFEREPLSAAEIENLSTAELYALYGALTQTKASQALAAPCTAGGDTLCLNNGRFQVTVVWSAPSLGTSGHGTAVPITGDTGYMWFFSDTNVELVIKVLDGTGINNHYWVFYGALSDVAYTITVTDTQTGAEKRYENPYHNLASFADTEAF